MMANVNARNGNFASADSENIGNLKEKRNVQTIDSNNNGAAQRKALAPLATKTRTNIPFANTTNAAAGKRLALAVVSKNVKEKQAQPSQQQQQKVNINHGKVNLKTAAAAAKATTKTTQLNRKVANKAVSKSKSALPVPVNKEKANFTIYCDEISEEKINKELKKVNEVEQVVSEVEKVFNELKATNKAAITVEKEVVVEEEKKQTKINNEKNECKKEEKEDSKIEIMAIDELTISEEEEQKSLLICDEKLEMDDNDNKKIDASMTELKENDENDENIENIDMKSISICYDQMLIDNCSEYLNEIHSYLLDLETKFQPDPLYMPKQQDVNGKMRCILVDWMIEVSDEYKLSDETLFLSVNFIDRFLSLMSIARSSFQLLGAASLFISAKYEEIYPPDVHEFVYITADSYTMQQVLSMEKLILKVLQFHVSSPTSAYFLRKYITNLNFGKHLESMAHYFCYLTLLDESFIKFTSSEIAIAAIVIAAHTYDVEISLDFYLNALTIHYEKEEKREQLIAKRINSIQECICFLYEMHKIIESHPQQAIRQKFSSDKYAGVANIAAKDSVPYLKSYF